MNGAEAPLTPESIRSISAESAGLKEKRVSAKRMIGQLVLFPFAIVVVCVAIYLLYSLLTREERTAHDLLSEVRAGGSSRRWQAAYSLAAMLGKEGRKDIGPELVSEMIRTFEDAKTDDPKVRRYLALSLGRMGDRRAVPAMIRALDDPDDETRIFAILSLGALGDTSGVAPLILQAESADPGIRKAAGHALGLLRDDRALPVLRGMLNAHQPDVRWNAALALCRFGDPSASVVIEQMLDRDLLNRIPELSEEQREDVMLNGIRGAALLGNRDVLGTLAKLKESDQSLKVRQAAVGAIEAVGQR